MGGPYLNDINTFRPRQYLEQVILDPKPFFPRTSMPPTLLEPAELDAVVDYLVSLS